MPVLNPKFIKPGDASLRASPGPFTLYRPRLLIATFKAPSAGGRLALWYINLYIGRSWAGTASLLAVPAQQALGNLFKRRRPGDASKARITWPTSSRVYRMRFRVFL